jgi:hypothetical protein
MAEGRRRDKSKAMTTKVLIRKNSSFCPLPSAFIKKDANS